MTPCPTRPRPHRSSSPRWKARWSSCGHSTRGDDEAFLEGLPEHQAVCLALQSVPLGPGDRPALEQLIALNNQIMATLDATEDTLRVQMAKGRTGARATTAYLR